MEATTTMADEPNESVATLDPATAPALDTAAAPASPQPATTTTDDADYKAFVESMKRMGHADEADGEPGTAEATGESAATEKTETDKAQPEAAKTAEQPGSPDLATDPKVVKLCEALKVKPDAAVDTAIEAVRRDGLLSDEDVESLYAKDPAGFVERGLKRAKAQRDQDAYGFEYRQWKAKQGTEAQASAEPAKPATEAAAAAQPTAEIQGVIEAALKPLEGDELLAELRKPMASALAAVADQVGKAYEAKLKSANDQVAAIQSHLVDLKIESERTRLTAEYPDLKDEEVFQRVLKGYDALVESPNKLPSVGENFATAVRAELGSAATLKLKEKLLSRAAQQRNGQPRATASEAGHRTMSPEDAERLAFNRSFKKHYGDNAA